MNVGGKKKSKFPSRDSKTGLYCKVAVTLQLSFLVRKMSENRQKMFISVFESNSFCCVFILIHKNNTTLAPTKKKKKKLKWV